MSQNKKSKFTFKAPFDVFATSQSLYIDGDDRTRSFVGFLCSILLAGLILFVVISEIVVFTNHDRSLIYTSELLLKPRPSIDLSMGKNLLVLRHVYTGNHYQGLQHKMFRFDLFYAKFSSEIGPSGFPYQENLFKIEPTPCDQLQKIRLSEINYNQQQLEDAVCYEFKDSQQIGYFEEGENSALAQYTIYMRPCLATQDNDCLVADPQGNVFDTQTWNGQTGPVTEYLRYYKLEVDLIQGFVELNDFSNPIQHYLTPVGEFTFDPRTTFEYVNFLAQIEVTTASGSFQKGSRVDKGIDMLRKTSTILTRDETSQMEKQYAGVLGNPEPLYFSLVLFQLSSKIRKIERDYQTIFDVMQNIGGVGEILLFVFFWVMHIHNSLLLDQYMLNSASLKKQQAIKLNQVTDSKLTQRHSLLGTESFTYFEALLFKYFGCCVRKEGKIKQYKRQIKMLRERMDVKNVILFEGYSLAIINATMEPYQIKLLKYLSQNDLEEYQDLTSIPIDDATSKLIEKLTLEENDLKPREKKANQYLITAVSQDQSLTPVLAQKIQEQESITGKIATSKKLPETSSNTLIKLELGEHNGAASLKEKAASNLLDAKSRQNDEVTIDSARVRNAGQKDSRFISAPFDFFGINAQLYMGGKTKASSWIGCLCTLAVLAVIVLFFLTYMGSFRNKDASKHTFSEITTDEFPTVDLGELKFKMLRSYFDADGTFFQMLQVKQELVKYGSKRQEISRTPIELGSCQDMSLEGLEGVDLEFVNDCLSFSLSTNIGREISSGSRTVVEISFYPCEVDCLAYPGDANYEQLLNDYLTSLFVELFVTESVLDIQDYDSPVKIGASDYFGFTLPAGKTVKNRFVLRETVVETKDGFIFQEVTRKKGLLISDNQLSLRNRISDDQPLGIIVFELANRVQMVQRIYPTIQDVLGNLGGFLQVIIFFAASFLGFYHSIGHEKTLLNDSLLQDEEQVGNILKTQKSLAMFRRNRKENSETVSSFSFTEIAKFKFFCCFDRKQEKYLRYKELLGNVSRKLDFARVMANQANVGLLSHVFLEPYQMRIVSQMKKGAADKSVAAAKLTLKQALDQLYHNLEEKHGREVQDKIDSLLLKLLSEDGRLDIKILLREDSPEFLKLDDVHPLNQTQTTPALADESSWKEMNREGHDFADKF